MAAALPNIKSGMRGRLEGILAAPAGTGTKLAAEQGEAALMRVYAHVEVDPTVEGYKSLEQKTKDTRSAYDSFLKGLARAKKTLIVLDEPQPAPDVDAKIVAWRYMGIRTWHSMQLYYRLTYAGVWRDMEEPPDTGLGRPGESAARSLDWWLKDHRRTILGYRLMAPAAHKETRAN